MPENWIKFFKAWGSDQKVHYLYSSKNKTTQTYAGENSEHTKQTQKSERHQRERTSDLRGKKYAASWTVH